MLQNFLTTEGLSLFAFRCPCPLKCLPTRALQWQAGEAYSTGVSDLCVSAVNYKIRTNSKLCKSKESDT